MINKTLKEVRGERLGRARKEYVSDWISELAEKDEGRVFHHLITDESFAHVTYGDLRKLMRQDAEINEATNAMD